MNAPCVDAVGQEEHVATVQPVPRQQTLYYGAEQDR
jgi:hypothetical protein